MAIDMPPALPPTLADDAFIQAHYRNTAAITETVSGITFEVIGNRWLNENNVRSILQGAKAPSEAITTLVSRYYETGHLLTKVHYFRRADTVSILVDQYTLSEVRGNAQVTAHFAQLAGDEDLTVAEFDRLRVMADLQARRVDIDYNISYQETGAGSVAMLFEEQPDEDKDRTDYILELNNKGSRFIGRYFGLAGIKHRFDSGTEASLAYQRAFPEWGEAENGESLHQFNASIDHPFTVGLYGVDLSYVAYDQDPIINTTQAGSCNLLLLGCTGNTVVATQVDLESEIYQAAVRGEQVLHSMPAERWRLTERLEYKDVETTQGNVSAPLLDEAYGVLSIGAHYTQFPARSHPNRYFSASLEASAGVGSGGTLDDYDNFEAAYLAANPTASHAPDIVPAARSAEFMAIKPKVTFQQRITTRSAMTLSAAGQWSGEQLPQQEQYVLGGLNAMSAWLPGALIGDNGYHLKADVGTRFNWLGLSWQPSLFVEYGASWFNNTNTDYGEEQSLADTGVRVKADIGKQLQLELVAAAPLADDVVDEDTLDDLEADLFARVRFEF